MPPQGEVFVPKSISYPDRTVKTPTETQSVTHALFSEPDKQRITVASLFEPKTPQFGLLSSFLPWIKIGDLQDLELTHAISTDGNKNHFLLASTINLNATTKDLARKAQVNSNSLFYQSCSVIVTDIRTVNSLRTFVGVKGFYYVGDKNYRLFIAYPSHLPVIINGVKHHMMFKIGLSIPKEEAKLFSLFGGMSISVARQRARK